MRAFILKFALGLLASPVLALNLHMKARPLSRMHAAVPETSIDRRKVLFVGAAAIASTPLRVLAENGPLADPRSAFVGRYTDPKNHPGGIRDIKLLDTKLGEYQLAQVTGGGGRGEPASFQLNAMVQLPEKRITIDFSPKGGPKDFVGLWDPEKKGIRFPVDGNFWPKQD